MYKKLSILMLLACSAFSMQAARPSHKKAISTKTQTPKKPAKKVAKPKTPVKKVPAKPVNPLAQFNQLKKVLENGKASYVDRTRAVASLQSMITKVRANEKLAASACGLSLRKVVSGMVNVPAAKKLDKKAYKQIQQSLNQMNAELTAWAKHLKQAAIKAEFERQLNAIAVKLVNVQQENVRLASLVASLTEQAKKSVVATSTMADAGINTENSIEVTKPAVTPAVNTPVAEVVTPVVAPVVNVPVAEPQQVIAPAVEPVIPVVTNTQPEVIDVAPVASVPAIVRTPVEVVVPAVTPAVNTPVAEVVVPVVTPVVNVPVAEPQQVIAPAVELVAPIVTNTQPEVINVVPVASVPAVVPVVTPVVNTPVAEPQQVIAPTVELVAPVVTNTQPEVIGVVPVASVPAIVNTPVEEVVAPVAATAASVLPIQNTVSPLALLRNAFFAGVSPVKLIPTTKTLEKGAKLLATGVAGAGFVAALNNQLNH